MSPCNTNVFNVIRMFIKCTLLRQCILRYINSSSYILQNKTTKTVKTHYQHVSNSDSCDNL